LPATAVRKGGSFPVVDKKNLPMLGTGRKQLTASEKGKLKEVEKRDLSKEKASSSEGGVPWSIL